MGGPFRFLVGGGGGGGVIYFISIRICKNFSRNITLFWVPEIKQEYFHDTTYPTIPSVVYLCGFHTRYLHSVSRQPSPRSKFSPSRPMTLMTSQSLPFSSASSVMIMCHSIALDGLAQRKNSFTLQCFLTWNSNQSDKNSPDPYPLGFDTKQGSKSPTNLSGPGLTPSKTASFFFFFLEHEKLAGTF